MAAKQAPAFEKGKLYNLPITDIKPDPDQPRKYMGPLCPGGKGKNRPSRWNRAIEPGPEGDNPPVGSQVISPAAAHKKEQKTGNTFVNRLIISTN
jgi:hypothetical protein